MLSQFTLGIYGYAHPVCFTATGVLYEFFSVRFSYNASKSCLDLFDLKLPVGVDDKVSHFHFIVGCVLYIKYGNHLTLLYVQSY